MEKSKNDSPAELRKQRQECYRECGKGLWGSKIIVESILHREVALILDMGAQSVILALRGLR